LELESFYLSFDIVSVNHLPGEGFYENKELEAADEDGGIHNLGFGLVGPEEFDGAEDGKSEDDEEVYPEEYNDGEHFSVVEVC
jgi:hypothetical protein